MGGTYEDYLEAVKAEEAKAEAEGMSLDEYSEKNFKLFVCDYATGERKEVSVKYCGSSKAWSQPTPHVCHHACLLRHASCVGDDCRFLPKCTMQKTWYLRSNPGLREPTEACTVYIACRV